MHVVHKDICQTYKYTELFRGASDEHTMHIIFYALLVTRSWLASLIDLTEDGGLAGVVISVWHKVYTA